MKLNFNSGIENKVKHEISVENNFSTKLLENGFNDLLPPENELKIHFAFSKNTANNEKKQIIGFKYFKTNF